MSTTISRITCGALVCAVAIAIVSPATAQVFNCGDTIGPKAKVTLTADVATCTSATPIALTIVGPATVDMAGHRVICADDDRANTGIRLEGKGVKLLTGGILDCGVGNGLEVAGEGKHKIEDFVVENSDEDGINVFGGSDGNKFKRVASNGNESNGWEINGNKTKVEDAAAVGNDDGFEIDGTNNQFKRITAARNNSEGFIADEGGSNKVKDGVFVDNGEEGVEFITGGNKIEKSVAVRNGHQDQDAGIDARNDVGGPPNQVKKCRAFDNTLYGIRTGGEGDKLTSNVALGNGTDLRDDTAACDGNQWKKNVFGTSDADGIPSPACIE